MKKSTIVLLGILFFDIATAQACEIQGTRYAVHVERIAGAHVRKLSLFLGDDLVEESVGTERFTIGGSVINTPSMRLVLDALNGDAFASQLVSGKCL